MNYKDEQHKETQGRYSPEVLEQLKACDSAAEVEKLIAENGIELSLEDLDQVSGGRLYIPLPNGDEIDIPWIVTGPRGFYQCDENGTIVDYLGKYYSVYSKNGVYYQVWPDGSYRCCG